MITFVQITAQYSNAVLVAVLPYVSDFCQRLDLPVSVPVKTNQVRQFKCDYRKDHVGGVVVLNNGNRFTFLDGRVCVYRSPWSYYSLQNVDEMPRFYGKVEISEADALRAAHRAIKQLGYSDAIFHADRSPKVSPPEKIGDACIPRYRFQWLKPERDTHAGNSDILAVSLDMEINASNGRVEMLCFGGADTIRPGPTVDVQPPLLSKPGESSNGLPRGLGEGVRTELVSPAYAKAFLEIILPQFSDYAMLAGLPVATPITLKEVDLSQYQCWSDHGHPAAQVVLKNGDRFHFNNGHVTAFYAHDAFQRFPFFGDPRNFSGKINMTTNEAVALATRAMASIGCKDNLSEPFLETRSLGGTNEFTRGIVHWGMDGVIVASCEVDMERKVIKGIFVDLPSMQRPSPGLPIPMVSNTNALQPAPSPASTPK
jgi:hypothetical protein